MDANGLEHAVAFQLGLKFACHEAGLDAMRTAAVIAIAGNGPGPGEKVAADIQSMAAAAVAELGPDFMAKVAEGLVDEGKKRNAAAAKAVAILKQLSGKGVRLRVGAGYPMRNYREIGDYDVDVDTRDWDKLLAAVPGGTTGTGAMTGDPSYSIQADKPISFFRKDTAAVAKKPYEIDEHGLRANTLAEMIAAKKKQGRPKDIADLDLVAKSTKAAADINRIAAGAASGAGLGWLVQAIRDIGRDKTKKTSKLPAMALGGMAGAAAGSGAADAKAILQALQGGK